jgi:ABC-type amino acid transport substrate-binding protein
LAGKKVAVIPETDDREGAHTNALREQFVTATLVRVKDHAEGIAAVEKGTVDAFASDRGVLAGLALSSKDPKRFAMSRHGFSYEPIALMVRRNDAAFRLVVNRALADLYRSGNIVTIYERWFGGLGQPGERSSRCTC